MLGGKSNLGFRAYVGRMDNKWKLPYFNRGYIGTEGLGFSTHLGNIRIIWGYPSRKRELLQWGHIGLYRVQGLGLRAA